MPELLLALDAGTTGARAMLVDPAGAVLGVDKRPIASAFPAPGFVEQDAAEVWTICRAVIDGALAAAGRSIADVAAIGVTTQRASIVLWDRTTGEPVAPMLVWSDLRGIEEFDGVARGGLYRMAAGAVGEAARSDRAVGARAAGPAMGNAR